MWLPRALVFVSHNHLPVFGLGTVGHMDCAGHVGGGPPVALDWGSVSVAWVAAANGPPECSPEAGPTGLRTGIAYRFPGRQRRRETHSETTTEGLTTS